MNRMNPLDEFKVTGQGLRFVNLSERYGFAAAGTQYEMSWSVYDNTTDTVQGLTDTVTSTDALLPLPANTVSAGDTYLMAEIRSRHDAFPAWSQPVRVYLRSTDATFVVVGIER